MNSPNSKLKVEKNTKIGLREEVRAEVQRIKAGSREPRTPPLEKKASSV